MHVFFTSVYHIIILPFSFSFSFSNPAFTHYKSQKSSSPSSSFPPKFLSPLQFFTFSFSPDLTHSNPLTLLSLGSPLSCPASSALPLSLSPSLSLILHNHVYLLFLSLYDSGSDHVLPTRLSASMGEVTHSVSGTSTCREHSCDADADSLGPIPHWKVLGCMSLVRRLRKSILQASRVCIRRWTC